MSVEKVAARVHQREAAESPDPLVMYDLGRVDGTDVSLPAATAAPASADTRSAMALALHYGCDVGVIAALTPHDLAMLAAPKPGADLAPDERAKLADKKQAMPDGSYPIRDASVVEDLGKAISSIGRAGPKGSDRYNSVKAWITRRANETNHGDMLPDDWKASK